MIINWLLLKQHYPVPIVLSFIPVFVGTLVSTYYDLQFNTFGCVCECLISIYFVNLFLIIFRCSDIRRIYSYLSNPC
jgi:1,4-dihydroxy-2-naphthoate octaprenyltransferase